MDDTRFDDLSRALAGGVSRRRALGLLLGGPGALLAIAGGSPRPTAAQDAARRVPGFENLGKQCRSGKDCGRYTECSFTKTCDAIRCWINGALVDSLETEQGNGCHICQPGRTWTRWSNVRDGKTCPPGGQENACLSTFIGTCQAGACVPEKLADGAECGAGQGCCRGMCCAAGVHCHPEAGCGGCDIGGVPHPAGVNAANVCQVCDAGVNPSSWTPAPGNPACGAALDRVCCNGDCCPPGHCCSPAGLCEECCADGTAQRLDGECGPAPEGCTVAGVAYGDGESNPENPCQRCDVGVSSTSWSSAGFGGCGANGERFCAGGVCCDLGICPDLGSDVCGDYCEDVCVIGGVLYRGEDRNPANPCEHCAPPASHTSWCAVPQYWYCNPVAQTGMCLDGECVG